MFLINITEKIISLNFILRKTEEVKQIDLMKNKIKNLVWL